MTRLLTVSALALPLAVASTTLLAQSSALGGFVQEVQGAMAAEAGESGQPHACGPRAVCLSPRIDAREACEAAMGFRAETEVRFNPGPCRSTGRSTRHGELFETRLPGEVRVLVLVAGGVRGFDRVLEVTRSFAADGTNERVSVQDVTETPVANGEAVFGVKLQSTTHWALCTEPVEGEVVAEEFVLCDPQGPVIGCTERLPTRVTETQRTYDDEGRMLREERVDDVRYNIEVTGREVRILQTAGAPGSLPATGDDAMSLTDLIEAETR